MLTENRIVDLVCDQLEFDGLTISQKLDTTQTGIDIVAVSETGKKYFVEAKGATSSKESTKRYGQEFNKSQVCLLYTSPSPRDRQKSRMPSSA